MAAAQTDVDANTARASYELPLADGTREITVTFSDGTVTRAVLQPNQILASAAPPPSTSLD